MENENRIIQISVEDLEKAIKLQEALSSLQNNKDYQYAIKEVYLKEMPLNLVGLKSSPIMFFGERKDSEKLYNETMLTSIAMFQEWVKNMIALGKDAKHRLTEYQSSQKETATTDIN